MKMDEFDNLPSSIQGHTRSFNSTKVTIQNGCVGSHSTEGLLQVVTKNGKHILSLGGMYNSEGSKSLGSLS